MIFSYYVAVSSRNTITTRISQSLLLWIRSCPIFAHLGFGVARVRVIFSMPPSIRAQVFANPEVAQHLAYVEWYTDIPSRPDPNHGLYKISPQRDQHGSGIIGSIIPISDIIRSIHLFPVFGPFAPNDWTPKNVLDHCQTFYLNPFTDRELYRLMGWWKLLSFWLSRRNNLAIKDNNLA